MFSDSGPPSILNGISVMQNGASQSFVYHQVYVEGGFVYDPRFSLTPVPIQSYIAQLVSANPGGVQITKIPPP